AFFNELEPVCAASVDIACKARSIIEDLTACLEDMGQRANRRGVHIEGQVRLGLLSAFSDWRSAVREASFLDKFDACGRGLARCNKVTDRQLAIRRGNDAWHALSRYERGSSRTTGTDSGIAGGNVSALH